VKEYKTENLRNICLVAHSGAGKTSLVQALLFVSGMVDRLGRVEEGNTVTDYDPDEIARGTSINLACAYGEWKDVRFNLLDTPGYADFVGEVVSGLSVADTALVVLSAQAGVEVGTELAWERCQNLGLPRVLFVNRMDKENADFSSVINGLRDIFGEKVVPVQLPVGQGEDFKGVFDLVTGQVLTGPKAQAEKGEVPDAFKADYEKWRNALVEAAAEQDDEILEKYLDGNELTPEEILKGLRAGVRECDIFPVLVGSAANTVGVVPLLDYIADVIPSPADRPPVTAETPSGEEVQVKADPGEELAALVFKTMTEPHIGELTFIKVFSGIMESGSEVLNVTKGFSERIGALVKLQGKERIDIERLVAGDIGAVAKLKGTATGDTFASPARKVILPPPKFPDPVVQEAIEAKSKSDEDKISNGLSRLKEEDPTFDFHIDADLKQTIVSGMGELHLEVILNRLKRKFGVEVDMVKPKIPYRETIKGTAEAQYRHKKQTGGRGQFGEVFIRLEPKGRGEGFEFVDQITGGVIPARFIPGVNKGIVEAMAEGVLANYPVIDLKVTLFDGKYHPVDSSELAFKIAGSMAFKKAFMEASPTLLEPIYNVKVIVPEENMGDVMGDLSSRRGKILGMDSQKGREVIRAQVPLAEMYHYSTQLRSMTQGRGFFEMSFSHYEEVPREIAQKIISEAQEEK